jgi:hypothetical protein
LPDPHLRSFSTDHGTEPSVLGGGLTLDSGRSNVGRADDTNSGWIAAEDGDQFARDVAAIEQAADILRRAQPALQSWAGPPLPSHNSSQPLWLIIGTLWVSTALVALSAVFALYVLAS